MKIKDIISSLFWLVCGIGVCYGGYDMGLGTMKEPGSGAIFFWAGGVIVVLSIFILIGALKKTVVPGEFNAIWAKINWKKLVIIMAALFLYGFALMSLGFILSTFLLLVFLFKAVEPQSWRVAILASVVTTLTAYGIFQLLLGSQLPTGLLGIG